jgi:hypothetical protein
MTKKSIALRSAMLLIVEFEFPREEARRILKATFPELRKARLSQLLTLAQRKRDTVDFNELMLEMDAMLQ